MEPNLHLEPSPFLSPPHQLPLSTPGSWNLSSTAPSEGSGLEPTPTALGAVSVPFGRPLSDSSARVLCTGTLSSPKIATCFPHSNDFQTSCHCCAFAVCSWADNAPQGSRRPSARGGLLPQERGLGRQESPRSAEAHPQQERGGQRKERKFSAGKERERAGSETQVTLTQS